jgi:L-alanine-DL-glutamate epimerase-like enolase superfamily enzyme
VWEAREVFTSFGRRDITLRYRQTALGVIWVILQPLLAAGIFTLVFGGIYRSTIPLIGAIGVKPAEEAAEDARHWKSMGAAGIKMKAPPVAQSTVSEIVSHIRAVRDAVGSEMMLIVDPNQGWINVGNAQRIIERIQDLDVYVEQPILAQDITGLKALSSMGARIIADEAVFTKQGLQAVIEARAASIVNIKLTRPGGYGEAMRFIHMAEGAGIQCQIDDVTSTRITTTAVAHLAAAVRPETFFCYSVAPAHMWLFQDLVKEGGITVDNGLVRLPEGDGLGITLDDDLLREASRRAVAE